VEDGVYMNVPAVRAVAKRAQEVSETLARVVSVLNSLSNLLRTTAFIGLVGGAAVAQFIDLIKPHLERVSNDCAELSKDLDASVDAYERGDALGAARFH
jgi:hypothetical protein